MPKPTRKINQVLAQVFGGGQAPEGLPPLPPVPGTFVGNPSIDAALARMPEDQARRLRQLIDARKFQIGPLRGPQAHYEPATGLTLDPMGLEWDRRYGPDTTTARLLTHEATHALQPDDFWSVWRQKTWRPVRAHDPATDPPDYADKPREREAYIAERLIQDVKRPPR